VDAQRSDAGQVLTLTTISECSLSTLIFGGAITVNIVASILLIAIGLVLTLRLPVMQRK